MINRFSFWQSWSARLLDLLLRLCRARTRCFILVRAWKSIMWRHHVCDGKIRYDLVSWWMIDVTSILYDCCKHFLASHEKSPNHIIKIFHAIAQHVQWKKQTKKKNLRRAKVWSSLEIQLRDYAINIINAFLIGLAPARYNKIMLFLHDDKAAWISCIMQQQADLSVWYWSTHIKKCMKLCGLK